jgi:Type VIII secretion system (T8SS), CsgF protein
MLKHLLKTFPLVLLITTLNSSASELTFQFNSPAFSGVGYSSHVLTIEQIEAQRKQKIKDDNKAAADAALRAANNTNIAKFLNNLESRIYAQLSKQLADQMFADGSANTGTVDFQGSSITWEKLYDNGTATQVQLTIRDAQGTETVVVVPIATFSF